MSDYNTNYDSNEEPQWNPMVSKFTSILAGNVPGDDEIKTIRVGNAPKKYQEEIANAEVKVDLSDTDTTSIVPFTHYDTYNDKENGNLHCIEEWRRMHPKDKQLTKVQVNWLTGKVTVLKQITEAQKVHDRREGRATQKPYQREDFDLNKPGAFRRAMKKAFL